MNYETFEKYQFIIVIFLLLIMTVCSIPYFIKQYNINQNNILNCNNLGFDDYMYNNRNQEFCIKEIGFDKIKGERIICHMPFEFKLTAEEWC
jgi:hypothetical protein